MWTDPIVDEVRQAREDLARKFDYDLDAILDDVRARQTQNGRQVVRRPPQPARRRLEHPNSNMVAQSE